MFEPKFAIVRTTQKKIEFCFRCYWCFEQKRAGTSESGDMMGELPPCSFIRRERVRRCLFIKVS